MTEQLMPRFQGEHSWLTEQNNRDSAWLFSIRWLDEQRFEHWLKQGFAGKNLVILGPPQITDPGIRLLVPIAEMAQTMEAMQTYNLGIPEPVIFCPIHINAWANEVETESNQAMADFYHSLACRYFKTFHPRLPLPILKTDQQAGVEEIAQLASAVKDSLSKDTLEELLRMANNHANELEIETLMEKTAGYLIAHYVAYRWLPMPSYYDISEPTLFLIPQSEEKFHDLMEAETVTIALKGIVEPDNNPEGTMVIAYSNILIRAHYYPHQSEPSLARCANQWPTRNQLSRMSRLNCRARDEICTGVQLIEADIQGKQNIPLLQQEVLKPLTEQMLNLSVGVT